MTGDDRSERVARLFAEALELDVADRAGFVEGACGEDRELFRELRSLLDSHGRAGGFLERLDGERAAALVGRAGDDPEPGTTVGPYRLVRELGRGGMGVVYLAERADGQFEQKVALKLIKRGMDSDEILERFLLERQVLAQLQHPNIARLLDGGIAEDGRPYFALEYVDGKPLTRFCDDAGLDVDRRLALFRRICRAVAYAHQNLVVHRDLKPSNVLVTVDGEPKLLDFGIAKIIASGGEAGPAAGFVRTRTGMQIATPEYASPEQLRGTVVGTTTDVYALGVVLFELLTGRRPYDFPDPTPEAMREVVLGTQPVRPSTAVVRAAASVAPEDATLEARARTRRSTPQRLRRRLRGDLDVIVLTALRKEPERRYASVEAFAADIDRHRAGLPVLARPDTWSYRTGKFVGRHRLAVTAATVVGLALAAGLTVALWQARVARSEAAKAGAVRDFVVAMFEEADPVAAGGEEVTAKELLDHGVEKLETNLARQPDIRAELESVAGRLYHSLGQFDRSIELQDKALELRRGLRDERGVAESAYYLAGSYHENGDYERAEPLLREALEIQRARSEDPVTLASTLNLLGLVLTDKGDYDAGEACYREALEILEAGFPGDHDMKATTLGNLGQVLKYKGDFDGAEPLYREALEMHRRIYGNDHPHVADIVGNLGVLLGQRVDNQGSIVASTEALEIRRRIYGDRHPDVALSLNNLAMGYYLDADYDRAQKLMREAMELNREIFGEEHRRFATNMNNLASMLKAKDDYAGALALYEESLPRQRRLLGDDHPYVALIEVGFADALIHTGDLERAETLITEAVETQRRQLEPTHPRVSQGLAVLGELRLEQGRIDEAERVLRDAVASAESALEPGSWKLAATHALLGECLARQGRTEEARALLVEAHDILEEKRGPDEASTRRARAALDRLEPVARARRRPLE